jgi:segregation and condensation protein A
MDLKFATNQVNTYRIKTPVYQGPLDLLLQLIESAELDITKLALAQVTDQYLAHLRELEHSPPDEISAFLVIAAKLLWIKSNALLPHTSQGEESEDVGDDLARQLIAYKRYKEIAELLADRKDQGYQSYVRISPAVDVKENVDFGEFDLAALQALARQVFQSDIDRRSIDTVVERPKVTIKDKIKLISEKFRTREEITFQEILGEKYSRIDIVITFLAVLELIKGKYIRVIQQGLFNDISLKRRSNNTEIDTKIIKELEL